MASDTARVKQLFLAASDIADAAERAAFLAGECNGNAELHGRVEALLQAHDAAPLPPPSAVDATNQNVSDRPGPTEHFGDLTVSVGSVLAGKYKLMQEIGEGGMGSVYMALQTEPVKRSVAVKVIKAGMDTKAVLARFEAERQALAMMDHPNIARVLDAGTTQGGRPFFVMELVKGQPITEFCDERRLTPRERLELFVPVCHAIQHAHQKGVIHRDIKPSNVLVAMFDDHPVPKVIDFGLAKAAGQTLTDKTLMTGFGAVVGTPEYMSPEQASLNNLDIDTRSDVYSLGVLLYELLTGSTPVDRKALGKAALMEVLRIVREVEAPRLSVKLNSMETLPSVAANRGTEPAKLSNLMKGELDWVVLKALNKNRARRYETANGIAADIQRYLANEAVIARPPTATYRMRKTWQRNRFALSAVLAIAVSLILGIAVSVWQTLRANREAHRALVALNELRDTAPAFIEQARSLAAKEQFTEAIEKLDYAAKLRPDKAEYLIAKGNLLQCQFRLGDAAKIYRQALQVRPDEPQAKTNAELCDELLAAPRASDGKLTRESLSKLHFAMQKQQRSAAELMAVSRLLGEEKKLVVAYWLERLKSLPISGDKPLEQRLFVRDDGMLELDLSGTKVSDLAALSDAPLTKLNAAGARQLTNIAALRGMNLIELNLAATQVDDLSSLENMHSLEKIELIHTPVSDLTPLKGIRLKYVNITNCPVQDISALRDAALEHLEMMDTRVTNLSPLVGMPLKFLDMGRAPVTDFTPLSGLPLEVCNFSGCQLTDIAVLRGLPLKELMLWGCYEVRNYAVLSEIKTLELLILPDNYRQLPKDELDSIGSLRSHPKLRQLGSESYVDHTTTRSKDAFWKEWALVESIKLTLSDSGITPKRVKLLNDGTFDLDLSGSSIVDLTVLQGMPIRELWMWKTDITDLRPLQGMSLKKLHIPSTKVIDLSPLKGMSFEYLNICDTKVSDISVLVGMRLNYLTIADCSELTDISPLKSMHSLRYLTLSPKAEDFEFLRSFPKLERLSFREDPNNYYLPDQTTAEFWRDFDDPGLNALRVAGYKLTKVTGGWELDLSGSAVKDLAFLRGTPISQLNLADTNYSDLTPLSGMPIKGLLLFRSGVVDLSPLKGMSLEHLNIHSTKVSDISALRGLPLTNLRLGLCDQLRDISPLQDVMTLTELTLPPNAKDYEFLRAHPNLQRLSFWENPKEGFRPDMSVGDFWRRHDRLKLNGSENAANKSALPKAILSPTEAKNHQNESIVVQIKVVSTGQSKDYRWYYMNSHSDYRDPENFCIAIRESTADRLTQLGLPSAHAEMEGQTIVASGKLGKTFSQGRPQLIVGQDDMIWIVED